MASKWHETETGFCQGDPGSPLATALLAGVHSRALSAETKGKAEMSTYVDDRKMMTETREDMAAATAILQELDRLSGQVEDPAKTEMATNGFDD